MLIIKKLILDRLTIFLWNSTTVTVLIWLINIVTPMDHTQVKYKLGREPRAVWEADNEEALFYFGQAE